MVSKREIFASSERHSWNNKKSAQLERQFQTGLINSSEIMNYTIRSNNKEPERQWTGDFGNWHQYIIRYWMKYLSPSEFMVLMFIVDRTLGWQKFSEVITRRHMLKGIASGGTIYHLGTSLSASTLDKILNSLEEKGVI